MQPAGESGYVQLLSLSPAGTQGEPNNMVFISCDPSTGFLDSSTLFTAAATNNVAAILLYSAYSDYCNIEDYSGVYEWIYSMKSANDTDKMLQVVQTATSPAATINQAGFKVVNGTGGGPQAGGPQVGKQNNQQSDLGPTFTTAVAMIVLYSITGVITALFLIIIVTGAVRAHRHPERYGPRNVIGRARQSRAKGVARAMLDTLPIVKFGERDTPKPVDTELAENVNSERRSTGASDTTTQDADTGTQQQSTEQIRQSVEGGIAAAAVNPERANPDNQGCSICTEDFEPGQDQRVLPCDHRFHPDCVDPWLLNVSGTCPLCRIDLRPTTSSTAETGALDENGNPILREGEFEPPPLGPQETAGERQQMTIRRSIMLGLMGIGRPDRMTREERVLALRQLRVQRLARERREQEAAVAETPEEEGRTRRRLRDALRRRPTRPIVPTTQTTQAAQPDGDVEADISSERQT